MAGFGLLSRSSLEPLISLDLVGTKLYCFRARVHCYHCLYIILSTNPVRRSEELRGGPVLVIKPFDNWFSAFWRMAKYNEERARVIDLKFLINFKTWF